MKIKSIGLLFTFLILCAALSTGCEYFWPGKSGYAPVLAPEIIKSENEYYTEPVKRGTVEKSRKIFSTFSYQSLDSGDKELTLSSTVLSDEYTLFKLGEKGEIVIDTTNPENSNFGKEIFYSAEVIAVPDDRSQGFIIKITENYDENIIKEGTLAWFKIVEEKKENVIVIPESAIRQYYTVCIVGVLKDGCREDREIKIGLYGDDTVEVISGLEEGELVVFN
jgi:hypothetical protein